MKIATRPRGLIRSTATAALVLALTACGGQTEDGAETPEPDATATDTEASASATPTEAAAGADLETCEISAGGPAGATAVLVLAHAQENGLTEEYAIDLTVNEYESVPSLYGDFVAGRFDLVAASPEAVAGMAIQGAPVSIIGTHAPAHVSIITSAEREVSDPTDLAGLRLAVPQGAGMVNAVAAAWRDWYDFDVDSDLELVRTQGVGEVISQVLAGTADAGMVWETAITAGLNAGEDMEVVYSLNEDFREQTGSNYWFNVWGQRHELGLPDECVGRFFEMLQESQEALLADHAMADALAVEALGANPGVYEEALSSGRMTYSVAPLDETIREEISRVLQLQAEAGDLDYEAIPESLWGQ